MKAIHNAAYGVFFLEPVVLYLKDTQKWKQFTTVDLKPLILFLLCYISKILKNESNSQQKFLTMYKSFRCVISQRYSKMKAIHNIFVELVLLLYVVLYLKDTQKWKQFTTSSPNGNSVFALCYISKILKNESNSQRISTKTPVPNCCVISQRYSKMKAIHNKTFQDQTNKVVVLYLKDTQKWKQFTTLFDGCSKFPQLCYISKILKNESNSQRN